MRTHFLGHASLTGDRFTVTDLMATVLLRIPRSAPEWCLGYGRTSPIRVQVSSVSSSTSLAERRDGTCPFADLSGRDGHGVREHLTKPLSVFQKYKRKYINVQKVIARK